MKHEENFNKQIILFIVKDFSEQRKEKAEAEEEVIGKKSSQVVCFLNAHI